MAKSGEVLSQNQIDSLLNTISSDSPAQLQQIQADIPQQDVRAYDFRHPSKFSREHVQTLQAVHEMFARLLSTQLTTQMRLPVQIEVMSVDQLTYDEFMRSITNPTVVMIYSMPPLNGNVLFEFTPGTAISIIERLLGGPGKMPTKARELTDIEQTLMSSVFNKGMLSLKEAWKNLVPDLQPILQTLETNPRFVQVSGAGDSVLVLSFEIRLGDSTGSMRLCLPYPTVESLLPQLNRQLFISGQKRQEEAQQNSLEMRRQLEHVELRLAILLGETEIQMRDLLALEVGDVLPLPTATAAELPVIIEQELSFLARPGTVGRKLAAQITQILDKGP
ncbi:MAG: flagellar motor switch protein FliM [Candidatus Sericytochromatia bacterium]|nr:flagellar motor switch protein FliM [Candidatus Sericytochromatia bacterium]